MNTPRKRKKKKKEYFKPLYNIIPIIMINMDQVIDMTFVNWKYVILIFHATP